MLGVKVTILSPIVFITLYPKVARPITIPTAPNNKIHSGVSELYGWPNNSYEAWYTAANGPIAFATSFDPWANATAQDVKIIK